MGGRRGRSLRPGSSSPPIHRLGWRIARSYAGQAEDAAEVLSLDAYVEVPFGTFDNVLETRAISRRSSPTSRSTSSTHGAGPVEVRQTSGGSSHEVLLTFEPG